MIKNILKHKIPMILLLVFTACGTNHNSQKSSLYTNKQSSDTSAELSSLSNDSQSAVTTQDISGLSFAEDMQTYKIATLEESEKNTTVTKAAPLNNAQIVADESQQTGNSIQSDLKDSLSDDEDNNSVALESNRYKIIGDSNVTFNAKEYVFKIAQDSAGHTTEVPTFVKKSGMYTVNIKCYCIDGNELMLEDGVFSMKIEIPSLNERGYYKVSSNILTNSAQEDVFAYIESSHEDSIKFSAKVDDFYVYNRYGTKSYLSNFELNFELR